MGDWGGEETRSNIETNIIASPLHTQNFKKKKKKEKDKRLSLIFYTRI